MNQTNKDTWCINAFHSIQGGNSGETRVCCMYRPQCPSEYTIGFKTLEEIFNQPEIVKLRNDLNNGVRNPGCRLCWEEEDAGRESKRLRDNKLPEPEGIAFLDLNLGNVCNIRCRTCGPHSSSQWIKEAQETTYKTIPVAVYNAGVRKYSNSYHDESNFWPDLENHLSTVKQFNFYGGEPFLSKKMWHILQVAADKGYAKDMEVHYATNGTVWPKEVEVWQHFKKISVSFSIDGIGPQFEFMRYPAVWNEVVDNINKARLMGKNIEAGWCVTLSTLNIYYLDTIIDEYYKNYQDIGLYLNLVHAPDYFNIGIMPDNVKEQVLIKLNNIPKEYTHVWNQLPGIIGFIENRKYNKKDWAEFLTTIKTHDDYRNQNYADIFPEFASIIGYTK